MLRAYFMHAKHAAQSSCKWQCNNVISRCSEPVSEGPGHLSTISSYLPTPATATRLGPGRDIWVCIYPGVRCPAHIMDKWSGHHLQEHSVTLVRGEGHQFVRYQDPRHSICRYWCNCSSMNDLMWAVTVGNKHIHTEDQDSLRCWHGQFARTLGVISSGMSQPFAAELFRAAIYPSHTIILWPDIGILSPGGGQADPAWGHCHHLCGHLQKRAPGDIRDEK